VKRIGGKAHFSTKGPGGGVREENQKEPSGEVPPGEWLELLQSGVRRLGKQ